VAYLFCCTEKYIGVPVWAFLGCGRHPGGMGNQQIERTLRST
jgi:hypothetical protein